MAKVKMLSSLVLGLALLASSAVPVLAGGGAGSGPGNNTVTFDCYAIDDGTNPPYVLSLTDENGTRVVRLGKSRLLCTPAAVTVVTGPVLNSFAPDAHVKCYEAGVPRDMGPGTTVTVTDSFSIETIEVDRLTHICTSAVVGP